jgi:hypothetical protein
MPLAFIPQPRRATTNIPAIIVGSRVTSQGSAHTQSNTIPISRKLLQLNSRVKTRIRAIIRMLRKETGEKVRTSLLHSGGGYT